MAKPDWYSNAKERWLFLSRLGGTKRARLLANSIVRDEEHFPQAVREHAEAILTHIDAIDTYIIGVKEA